MCEEISELKCEFCSRIFTSAKGLSKHKTFCKLNLNRDSEANNHIVTFNKSRTKEGGWPCKYCSLVLRTRRELYNHYKEKHSDKFTSRKDRPYKSTWKCKYCGANFNSRRLLYNHAKCCNIKSSLPKDSLGRTKQIYTDKDVAICEFCNREFVNSQSFKHHVLYCKENPNHIIKTHVKHTDEAKQKISNKRLQALAEGRGNTWVCPHINRSYAEQYFYNCFINAGIKFNSNVWIKHYCVDFLFDGNIYLEIDGEQHFTDKAIQHDKDRETFLNQLGYTCLERIRWSSFKQLSNKDKINYINNLIEKIKLLCPNR